MPAKSGVPSSGRRRLNLDANVICRWTSSITEYARYFLRRNQSSRNPTRISVVTTQFCCYCCLATIAVRCIVAVSRHAWQKQNDNAEIHVYSLSKFSICSRKRFACVYFAMHSCKNRRQSCWQYDWWARMTTSAPNSRSQSAADEFSSNSWKISWHCISHWNIITFNFVA